ncbi:MAG: biotin--[acetyl-CoA-carboxylase] ligase [Anaerolineales bacterium]|nr:biotin--[acetyl-CoA-carboxylase] ligase [Anaerolineales bacterium]
MATDLHAPDVLHGLAGLRFGHPVYIYQQIGSTNTEAKRLAEAGAPEGLLVMAETQTAGRGRAGRHWLTPPGGALAFSLVLRPALPPAQAARLTMLAGLAVCEGIELASPLRVELKWPNDILVNGKKAGGILVESGLQGDRLDYAVVGIGLNVSQAPGADQVEFPATALADGAGQPIDRLRLLRACLNRLQAQYARLADGEALRADWTARLAWLGEKVVVTTADGALSGQAEGVDADGALLIRGETGEALRLVAGDVRLRQG